MQTPEFWNIDCAAARAFTPLSWMFAAAGRLRRRFAQLHDCGVPVVCVGNVVAGGAGKTPICLSLGQYFKNHNKSPVFLGYGYGGVYGGPLVVDSHKHTAIQVGDEALLLTRTAATIIGEDRVGAAKLAVSEGADLIIMDDGFQNPYLKKDLSLLVIDGEYGIGNGRVIPAGPLRERFSEAVNRADAIVLYGQDKHGLFSCVPNGKPVLEASLVPDKKQINRLRGKKLVAFAGIGRPEKFFRMLRQEGLDVVSTHMFPDHHYFNSSEILLMMKKAEEEGAIPVTTTKDCMRLELNMREHVEAIQVHVEWKDPARLDAVMQRFTA